jgi:hypothetical protein
VPFDAPFKLGPFIVDTEGRLAPNKPEDTPAFLFRWRQRVVRARLVDAPNGEGSMVLQTTLGRVPSTASVPEGALRPQSFALLHWLPRYLPPEWRMMLLSDHRIILDAQPQISFPITAASLLRELTCFLLALSPYLDLLDEAGVNAAA